MADEFTGRDVFALMLNDPAQYEQLLHSYDLLLGQRKSWWERVAQAEHLAWKSCVRGAISQIASQCGVPVRTFAHWLDTAPLPKARSRVLEIARNRFASASR